MANEVNDQELTDEQLAAQEEQDFLAAYSGEETEVEAPDSDEGGQEAAAETTTEATKEEPEETDDDELANLPASVIEKLEARLTSQIEQRLSGRLRNIEGHIGGLKHNLTELSAASKAAKEQGSEAPSKAQLSEAMKNGEKFDALKEDFPEWAEALEEGLQGVASKIPQIDEGAINQRFESTEKTAQQLMQRARQMARLDNAYPDWEETIRDDAYRNWLANQPAEIQQKTSSDNAADAIDVLKKYHEHIEASNPDLTAQRRQTNRLESAITPTSGGQVTRRQPKTEHEEFLEAFNGRG